MKKIILVLTLVFTSQISFAQDEAMKKDIMRIIEMSGSAAQMKAVKDQVLQMVPAPKQAAFLVEFEASLPGLYDKLIKVYADTYTKEDIKAIMAFYDSPVGKKMAAKSDEIFQKSQVAGTEWGQSLQGMMMKYMQ